MKPTLIDTECWLWWHLAPERLGAACPGAARGAALAVAALCRELVGDRDQGGPRKARAPGRPDSFVPEQLADDGIDPLAIEHAHASASRLPPHHSDPFDRLLIAQAQLERCAFLTADAQLVEYEVDLVWPVAAARRAPGAALAGECRPSRPQATGCGEPDQSAVALAPGNGQGVDGTRPPSEARRNERASPRGRGSSRNPREGTRHGHPDTPNGVRSGGVDGTRTRDLRRDRPAF